MTSTYIGIDPGLTGSIAVILEDRGRVADYYAYHMPSTLDELADLLKGVTPDTKIGLEKVGPWKASAGIFKFGKNFGHLQMGLKLLDLDAVEVRPVEWQKPLGLIRTSKSETDTAKKNRHKDLAIELFPGIQIVHQIADAFLIAHYMRLTYGPEKRKDGILRRKGKKP